jgi:hypothetical protein
MYILLNFSTTLLENIRVVIVQLTDGCTEPGPVRGVGLGSAGV